MDSLKPPLPKINDEDRTPIVDVLLELVAWQDIKIDKLEQEILKLKAYLRQKLGRLGVNSADFCGLENSVVD